MVTKKNKSKKSGNKKPSYTRLNREVEYQKLFNKFGGGSFRVSQIKYSGKNSATKDAKILRIKGMVQRDAADGGEFITVMPDANVDGNDRQKGRLYQFTDYARKRFGRNPEERGMVEPVKTEESEDTSALDKDIVDELKQLGGVSHLAVVDLPDVEDLDLLPEVAEKYAQLLTQIQIQQNEKESADRNRAALYESIRHVVNELEIKLAESDILESSIVKKTRDAAILSRLTGVEDISSVQHILDRLEE